MFTEKDLQQIEGKGITADAVMQQIECFKNGFPFINILSAASVGNGILKLTDEERARYETLWDDFREHQSLGNSKKTKVMKFVPASGAASRMFKFLFAYLDASYDLPQTEDEIRFFENIGRFAFFDNLNNKCKETTGKDITKLIANGEQKEVVRLLLLPQGLGYAALPKGMLLFHKEGEQCLTPIDEHLREAVSYTAINGKAHLHFTVGNDDQMKFSQLTHERINKAKELYDTEIDVSFSTQLSSTDTIAVDANNQPFRNNDGSLLFRPGGHGALIENLNNLDADVVFIKNIDNVCHSKMIGETIEYKKVLGGLLLSIKEQIDDILSRLDNALEDSNIVVEHSIDFMRTTLMMPIAGIDALSTQEQIGFIRNILMRPVRVCGMVKNVGEPGGGPFLVKEDDGSVSFQILESSQIDMNNATDKRMFEEGTHFNPVDLVCSITDYRGRHFNLPDFVDNNAGFISNKSKDGKALKALELPGLWNGAMSRWITVFVEVPLSTFNPVKTVNDLLRPEHQE